MPKKASQETSALAGCPLNGFDGCAREACHFFFPVDIDKKETDCLFRQLFFDVHMLKIVIAPLLLALLQNRRWPLDEVSTRIVAESLVLSLRSLEGFATTLPLGSPQKASLDTLRAEMAAAMEKFAGE